MGSTPTAWRLPARWVLLSWIIFTGCQARVARVSIAQDPPLVAPTQQELATETALLAARDREDLGTQRAHAWDVWRRLQGQWQQFERSDAVIGQPDRIFRGMRP